MKPHTATAAAILGVFTVCLAAAAAPLPQGEIPVPTPRPQTSAPVPTPSPSPSISPAVSIEASAKLEAGLDALSDGDPDKARAIRDSMPRSTTDRHILTWSIALSGLEGVPSDEIRAAADELEGWPGLGSLKALSERALFTETPSDKQVLRTFGEAAPETVRGTILLVRALLATGQTSRAETLAAQTWRTERMDREETGIFLDEFTELLTKADHLRRMEMLLYRDHLSEAEPLAELAEAQSLYRAWRAVIRNPARAADAISRVHLSWHDDPAYLFIRIRHLRELERDREAAKLLAKMPRDKSVLVDPDEWWIEARVVSRGLYEKGEFKEAYDLAAAHLAQSPADYAEAEFHAGWYALRGLKDPQTASRHFGNLLKVVDGQISTARGHYWLGRAAEAAGESATPHYERAAGYPTTFYGQLAAAKLGRKSLNIVYPSPSEAERTRFASREAVAAIRKLESAGHQWRADSLFRALAEQLESPGELAILAAMAERRGDHQISLQVGKIAWNRGLEVAALAYPLGAVPASANISGAGKALAYSIARQESAFNKAAVSPANARGLLQLLPGTAKGVAARHGLTYSKARLTTDAGYNATLGAHFLGEQISDFGGSYILTFIAYNAGPRRVSEWIERFGDPRGKPLDEVIDWIELIPFTETRHYVQRILENYQVYKARLGQSASIESDLRFGRR
ncbi:transglycosylase SLT domain-containing protein [Hoeflea sp.]|uniref:lytic transglycosylase domain-containing protein n=1 Tax=Hoeflea sp. TaxID=1940281 RepID=UPI003B51A6D7